MSCLPLQCEFEEYLHPRIFICFTVHPDLRTEFVYVPKMYILNVQTFFKNLQIQNVAHEHVSRYKRAHWTNPVDPITKTTYTILSYSILIVEKEQKIQTKKIVTV